LLQLTIRHLAPVTLHETGLLRFINSVTCNTVPESTCNAGIIPHSMETSRVCRKAFAGKLEMAITSQI
jgi:hypothetical protein